MPSSPAVRAAYDAYEALAAELILDEVRLQGPEAAEAIVREPVLREAWRYFFRALAPDAVLGRLANGGGNWRLVLELRRAMRIAREIV